MNKLMVGSKCIGQTVVNKQGSCGVIVDCILPKPRPSKPVTSVLVKFSDGYSEWYYKHSVKKGSFKNPYHPSIYGVACFGKKYSKHPLYGRYFKMIGRCYDKDNKDYGLYGEKGVRVCDRWLCFENYVDDVSGMDNYDKLFTEGYEIDKDIFGDKMTYSLESCSIVKKSDNIARSNIDRYTKSGNKELTLIKDGETHKCNINTADVKILCDNLNFNYNVFREYISVGKRKNSYKGYKIIVDII